jgi:centromere/kinetochore protein ZW10
MATDVITPSVLSYITHNTYPDSESVFSADLSSATLSDLLHALRKEQDVVKFEIRSLSQTTAPDIDSWISRAKELQADILRSRETARQIVADAEAGKDLHAEVEDKAKKLELLEKEVDFNETLTGTLDHVRYANGLLDRAQEEAVLADVQNCLESLEEAESSIAALDGVAGSRAVDTLRQRAVQLRDGIKEAGVEFWDGFISVNTEEKWVRIQESGVHAYVPGAKVPELGLDAIVEAAKRMDVFDFLVQKLAKDLDRAVLRPRMTVSDEQLVAKVDINGEELSCAGVGHALDTQSLFEDLRRILGFLSSRLPKTVTVPLSSQLVPALANRLENHWLDPAVPVSMKDIPDFQVLLDNVTDFAEYIESLGWSGSETLREWTQDAPRAWLTKRREAVLGDVRNLVFEGLRERKVVERVETRVVNKEDMGISSKAGVAGQGNEADNDWDDAWDEPDEEPSKPAQKPINEDDDDSSAWDLEEEDPPTKGESGDGPDNDDAWGWGDEEQKPPSPVANKKQPKSTSASKPNGDSGSQQELTLRETFTVSAIPDGILAILQQTVSDAETLAGPQYAESPLAPAARGLYSIPTLALAIYRATAPTAYAKVDGLGNMLIYNDASRLADQLSKWQGEQLPRSRLRVDNDVAALQTFAKRAYASEMDAQRTILKDLLDGAQGFANCTQQPFKQECEGAVDATIDRLRDVNKMWKGILSQGALLQSLGSLLGTVTGKMISEIEDLGDISEADSQQLKALCDRVLSVNDIFTQQNGGEAQDMTFIYCPTWLKFQYLAEILESSLADIKWMWKEGELSLEFAAEEVVELVEALFAESELRRGAVRDIRRGR